MSSLDEQVERELEYSHAIQELIFSYNLKNSRVKFKELFMNFAYKLIIKLGLRETVKKSKVYKKYKAKNL